MNSNYLCKPFDIFRQRVILRELHCAAEQIRADERLIRADSSGPSSKVQQYVDREQRGPGHNRESEKRPGAAIKVSNNLNDILVSGLTAGH